MKVFRLPIWLILAGSLLLTLFFSGMLSQSLESDRAAFQRDLDFQSQEQGITINAARAGLERRVQLLATTLAANPVIRELVTRAVQTPDPEERDAVRRQLRESLTPYWQALRAGRARGLNVFLGEDVSVGARGEPASRPFLRMEPTLGVNASAFDDGYLARQAMRRETPVSGIAYDGERAATAGIAPLWRVESGQDNLVIDGLLEIEFGVVPDADYLAEQLGTRVAILTRRAGEGGGPGWHVDDASDPTIDAWLTRHQLPALIDEAGFTVVAGDDGRYLLSMVPFGRSGDDSQAPVAAVAVWKDITPQIEGLDAQLSGAWLRWGIAWLIAEACLLLLLWGTRRATRGAMLVHQQRLESQKATLESLNHRLEAQKETFRTLNDIAALQESSFLRLLERALETGAAHLGMPFALASRIEGDDYAVRVAYSPDQRFSSGQRLEVRDTYCELTLKGDDVVAFADADREGMAEHPCRLRFGLKSYIGTPIWVHGERYGALAFSSEAVHHRPFDEIDKEFVGLLARWIGATLMRWREVAAREEMSQRLAKIASQTPGMIYQYRMDAEGQTSFPYASDAMQAYYGVTPAAAAQDASRVTDAIVEEDREQVVDSILRSRETLSEWHAEYRVKQPDGRIIWLAGQSTPERESDGSTLWHGFVHDITERKRSERLKGEFISTVSHELRTPLTSISGSLGLIQGGALGTPPESMQSMLAVAHSNSQRLILLINDLLDMEKLVAGKMSFQLQEQALMPLIDHAIEANQAYADQFRVHYAIIERLEGAYVNVDAMRLQQILSNLLSNAAKFSPANRQVEIRVESVAERVRVSVIDHGPGIPSAFHERIFQKFSQADASSTRRQGGTGLGLAITRELVERMRGSINFFSEEGQGACFFFELPRVDPVLVARGDAGPGTGHAGSRLLIVEDDPDTALLLALLVRQWGYRAEIAHTLEEALNWLERRSFDAVTLDLLLPDGNGLALLRQLRENPRTRALPVLVVSAIAEEGRLAIGGELNAVDWLGKPFDERRLAAALQGSLSESLPHERVMHVESDADLTRRVATHIAPHMTLDVARSLQEARYLLASHAYGLISLDLTTPTGPAWEMIPLLSQLAHQPAVIILSEETLVPTLLGRVETAIAAPGLSADALREAFDRQLHARPIARHPDGN